MREPSAPSKPSKPPNAAKQRARSDRLAQALRANLARRKAQQRARNAPGEGEGAGDHGQNDKNEG